MAAQAFITGTETFEGAVPSRVNKQRAHRLSSGAFNLPGNPLLLGTLHLCASTASPVRSKVVPTVLMGFGQNLCCSRRRRAASLGVCGRDRLL